MKLPGSADATTSNGNGRAAPTQDDARAPQADGQEVFKRLTERPADLLRFATAGSVDDGKSTLIGRLLYDSKQVLTDQL
jgi:GTPase